MNDDSLYDGDSLYDEDYCAGPDCPICNPPVAVTSADARAHVPTGPLFECVGEGPFLVHTLPWGQS